MCLPVSISGIFSSPNFWTAISGFGGAITGAVTGIIGSYYIHRIAEKRRIRDLNFSKLLEAFNQMGAFYDFALALKSQYDPRRSDSVRNINIEQVLTYPPNFDDVSFFSCLPFLARDNAPLLEEMEFYRSRCRTLLNAFDRRNKMYEEKLGPKIEKLFPSATSQRVQGDAHLDDIIKLTGHNLFYSLKGYTDAIFSEMDFIVSRFPELEPKIISLLNTKR
jgi:hypothetical protein